MQDLTCWLGVASRLRVRYVVLVVRNRAIVGARDIVRLDLVFRMASAVACGLWPVWSQEFLITPPHLHHVFA